MGTLPAGIDCADEIIKCVKDIATQISIKAEFVCDDALNMPFSDASFDIMFLLVENNIAEFSFSDVYRMCKQIKRVLKTGSKFCVGMNYCIVHNNGKIFDLKLYDYLNGKLCSYYTFQIKVISNIIHIFGQWVMQSLYFQCPHTFFISFLVVYAKLSVKRLKVIII